MFSIQLENYSGQISIMPDREKHMHGSVRSKVKGISNDMISLECDIQSRLQV